MSANRLGPLDVSCDAPPYSVVQACRRCGFQDPEDVRWCRMCHLLNRQVSWRELLHFQTWRALLGMNQPGDPVCVCGQQLPALERYSFFFLSGQESSYLLGQCRRCRTVFWEEADPVTSAESAPEAEA